MPQEPLPSEPTSLEILAGVVRSCASLVGAAAIGAGLWLAIQLFGKISEALQKPDTVKGAVEGWAALLGGAQLTLELPLQKVPLAPTLATGALALGVLLLVKLVFGIMLTGAKVVVWTSPDPASARKLRDEVAP